MPMRVAWPSGRPDSSSALAISIAFARTRVGRRVIEAGKWDSFHGMARAAALPAAVYEDAGELDRHRKREHAARGRQRTPAQRVQGHGHNMTGRACAPLTRVKLRCALI